MWCSGAGDYGNSQNQSKQILDQPLPSIIQQTLISQSYEELPMPLLHAHDIIYLKIPLHHFFAHKYLSIFNNYAR